MPLLPEINLFADINRPFAQGSSGISSLRGVHREGHTARRLLQHDDPNALYGKLNLIPVSTGNAFPKMDALIIKRAI